MEGGERKPDVAKVASAILQLFMACAAGSRPAGGSQPGIEGAMAVGHTAVLDIVQ